MTLPNFLIIGAMKSGTTALYYYLAQHPQVYMSPVKEPNFFCSEGQASREDTVARLETYQGLFKDVSDEKVIGEASHCYLYEPEAAVRIQQYLPDAKFVAVLRDPVDRAYSHFLHMVRNGTEPLTDFAQALREEEVGAHRERSPQDYIGRGLYYDQLKRYFDTFGQDQVRVYLYEDLSEGAQARPHEPPREPPPAPYVSEIRTALAKATPESLRRFEERYGPAEPESAVIHNDGRVTVRRMALDGSVSTAVLEGADALGFRRKARGWSHP